MSESHSFDSFKIFKVLFILTVVEVAWGYMFNSSARWLLWGGLLVCAYFKALLIFQYFMHMKFEGWIVKCLIAPTPLLVVVILVAISPDVSRNKHLLHEVADQLDPVSGQIAEIGTGSRNISHNVESDHGDGGGGH